MGRRTKLAEGCWADASGTAVIVTIQGKNYEERHPRGTPVADLIRYRARFKADLLDAAHARAQIAGPEPERGTWAGDVPRRLKQIEHWAQYKADRSHLAAWLPYLGTLHRSQIKNSQVQAAVDAWAAAKKSPATIKHRVRVFRELYVGLDGAHAQPPLQGVADRIPKAVAPTPMPTPLTTIQAVDASMARGLRGVKAHGPTKVVRPVHYAVPEKTRARFQIRSLTGQRPVAIGYAKPEDVDFDRRIWFVRPSKDGHPIPFPMNDEVIAAWQNFAAVDAWGPFDPCSFSKTARRHGWPKTTRPYNLRHTFAIDCLLNGVALADLQGLLGHRQIETTRRFYGPVLFALLQQAVQKRQLRLSPTTAPAFQEAPEAPAHLETPAGPSAPRLEPVDPPDRQAPRRRRVFQVPLSK